MSSKVCLIALVCFLCATFVVADEQCLIRELNTLTNEYTSEYRTCTDPTPNCCTLLNTKYCCNNDKLDKAVEAGFSFAKKAVIIGIVFAVGVPILCIGLCVFCCTSCCRAPQRTVVVQGAPQQPMSQPGQFHVNFNSQPNQPNQYPPQVHHQHQQPGYNPGYNPNAPPQY